jgi:hypothetical protein
MSDAFKEWVKLRVACVGYPVCDGDLVGEDHDKECPASKIEGYHKPTMSEAFTAGRIAGLLYKENTMSKFDLSKIIPNEPPFDTDCDKAYREGYGNALDDMNSPQYETCKAEPKHPKKYIVETEGFPSTGKLYPQQCFACSLAEDSLIAAMASLDEPQGETCKAEPKHPKKYLKLYTSMNVPGVEPDATSAYCEICAAVDRGRIAGLREAAKAQCHWCRRGEPVVLESQTYFHGADRAMCIAGFIHRLISDAEKGSAI